MDNTEDTFSTTIGGSKELKPVGSGSMGTGEDSKPQKTASVLDSLREELEQTVTLPDIFVTVPAREHIKLLISPNVTQAQLLHWRNNSGGKSKAGINSAKFASYVVGETLQGIYFDGELVENEDGVPLTFASTEIQEMSNASDPFQAIKDMYGAESHLEAAASAIIDASGWGADEVETEDPTKRP